jgi:diketogulonate reductase-like aldo/keto reductase
VPASADALVGEFDFSAEKVLLNSGWEMPIIGTGTWTLSDEEAENYDIFDFELSEDEMDRIRGIDEQRRYEHW